MTRHQGHIPRIVDRWGIQVCRQRLSESVTPNSCLYLMLAGWKESGWLSISTSTDANDAELRGSGSERHCRQLDQRMT